MVHTALDALRHALHTLLTLLPYAGVGLLLLLAGLLLSGLLHRTPARRARRLAGRYGPRLAQWTLLILALGATASLLRVTRHAVDARLAAQQNARYANAADPDGGQTVQAAPRASVLDTHNYTRTLLLPRDLGKKLKQDGLEALLPYLGQPDGQSVRALREGFTRRGDRLEYTRVMSLQTEEPVNLDSSRVATTLNFVDPTGGRGMYYNAAFTADYAFTNPRTAAATMRFAFPLPSGSGTLSNFRLTVNGQVLRAADLTDGSVWQGEVPAGGVVKVNVAYRNQGARSWRYELAQRREAIRQFDLSVTTDQPAKFQRYTMFPTRQTRAALGSVQRLQWQLQDVVTAQDISLVFAQGSVRETLGKIGLVQVPALLLALGLTVVWAWTRRRPLSPLPLAAAALGLGLGFTLGGVLTAYLPLVAAQVLGALAGLALATSALGRAYVVPLALGAVIPLVFLSGGHAGLLLTTLAALVLLLCQVPPARRPAAPVRGIT